MLKLDDQGWLCAAAGVTLAPSPNHDLRPQPVVDLLVIHNISLPPNVYAGDAVVQFFQNTLDFDSHPWFEAIRDVRVSAHFFIRRTGEIIQLVSTDKRAWHAGVSQYDQREQCNDFSVGIELEGSNFDAFEAVQYRSLVEVAKAIKQRHPVTAVRGHEHIAPGRKTDPGPYFDWHQFCEMGPWPRTAYPLPLKKLKQ